MRDRVLAVARAELGTKEHPPGSNRQKYGAAYGWNGVAWCAQGVWWVLTHAGAGALVPKTAGTVFMRDWYRARGQWHLGPPEPGDIAFFKFAGNSNPVNHVGIVEAVERGGTIICIEFNTAGTAAGDQRNGGMVARKRRSGAGIVGYARPAYPAVPAPPAAPPAAPAATGLAQVRALQVAVRIPPAERDGVWGRQLDGALNLVRDATRGILGDVRAAQRVVGTAVDGRWGPGSREALIETVRDIQRALGVPDDGGWGPRTDGAWAAARRAYGRGL